MFQELIDKDQYDFARSDERVYLDLRASSRYTKETVELERNDLKINLGIMFEALASKKLRVRIWAYSLGEFVRLVKTRPNIMSQNL